MNDDGRHVESDPDRIANPDRITDLLGRAREELRRERRRTSDELEAMHTFEDRVRAIDPERPASQDRTLARSTRSVATTTADAAGALSDVRAAYEATVMSVPHYIEEYDDTYPESIAEEFDTHLAVALTDGTTFDERCKRLLLSAVSDSLSSRASLLDAIGTEADSIADRSDEVQSVAEELAELTELDPSTLRFGTLGAYRTRLKTVETKLGTISERRQDAVFEHRRAAWLPASEPDMAVYFYQDLAVDYPVMSAVAGLLDRIEELRSDIEGAMAFCHG